ncbi:DUF4065 domain-containing protein [Flavobacterium sp. MAH-1]|uniref:DUF4065 domain-containing protein n=1 Tax=Flavobacterium agri TaxID=2743471 RepID=A0A7Y8Y173_9FLAO|nr:type II toxin-antitoxin system antitoxin SocA domain-containing protein [Flavobacterium agri]NUY80482.1 DUF4065 domain-containing protein [Flavobacterium agri]NYA70507.1 DUF4065 domain-containing protein [Flavobacterium agri]
MPYSALTIANQILKKAKQDGQELSNMKLQKLLYIANGLYLAKSGTPLIEDPIEVWPYGPVVREVYHRFKTYGNKEIPVSNDIPEIDLDIDSRDAIEFALEISKRVSAIQLSNWTHKEGAPWTEARKKDEQIISNKSMEEFFSPFKNYNFAGGAG